MAGLARALGRTISSSMSRSVSFSFMGKWGPSIRLSQASVAENAADGSTIGTLSVVNGEGTWSFTKAADPDAKFGLTGADLTKAAAVDYETKTAHSVTIQATNGTDTITRTFNIGVVNVLELTISTLSMSPTSFTQDAAAGTVIGTVSGLVDGSIWAVFPNDGRVAKSGNNLVVGLTQSTGDFSITLRHTHPDAVNSPVDAVVPLTVTPPAVVEPVITVSDATDVVAHTWAGAVTPNSMRVSTKLAAPADAVRLAVSPNVDLSGAVYSDPVPTNGLYAIPSIDGLPPNTAYYYGIRVGDVLYRAKKGRFKTLPPAGAASFRFAFGNCNSGTSSETFTAVNALNPRPLFLQHLGDLHYGDIESTDEALYDAALDGRFTVNLEPLMREMPFLWTWGDHDFGNDGSDSTQVGRQANLNVYRKRVPAPDYWFSTDSLDPVGYSYVVGRVRFIVPDQRSSRVGNTVMWGAAQKQKIMDEFSAAKLAGQFVVFCSESPFASEFSTTDRTDLANHIKAEGLEGRVLAIAGDAHSIQIDDGTNHDFATGGGGKMFVIHAGAFSQGSSLKGGPYSHGQFAESTKQAGYIDITDTGGDTIDLTFTGIKNAGDVVVTFAFQLSLVGYISPRTYTITPSVSSVNEGGSVTFNIASNAPNTSVVLTLSGVGGGDVVGGVADRTVALDGSGNGALVLTLTDDLSTEGAETLTVRVKNQSFRASVTVNDTSPTPVSTAEGIGVVQANIAQRSASGTSHSVTLDSLATAGNLLLAYITTDAVGITYTTPTGWTLVGTSNSGFKMNCALFSKTAAGGETTSGAFTVSIATAITMAVIEIEGMDAANPVDQLAFALGSAGVTSRASGTATTGATDTANELALAFWSNDSASTVAAATAPTWGNGFTTIDSLGVGTTTDVLSSSAPAVVIAEKLLASTGEASTAFSYAGGSSDENILALVTVRPAQ